MPFYVLFTLVSHCRLRACHPALQEAEVESYSHEHWGPSALHHHLDSYQACTSSLLLLTLWKLPDCRWCDAFCWWGHLFSVIISGESFIISEMSQIYESQTGPLDAFIHSRNSRHSECAQPLPERSSFRRMSHLQIDGRALLFV